MNFKALQQRVAQSKTTFQSATGIEGRAMFLATEAGEVLKAVLEYQGYYGDSAIYSARERIARELCDIIWNACDLATMLGIDLQAHMDQLLRDNPNRVWKDERR